MTATRTTSGRPPDRKAVLFCFECDHESSITGDWIRERRDGRVAYRCPDCGTTISVRPREGADRADGRNGVRCRSVGD